MIDRLRCGYCGKSVSTEFIPRETDTPDKGIIIRALIICPECIEKELVFKRDIEKDINRI